MHYQLMTLPSYGRVLVLVAGAYRYELGEIDEHELVDLYLH